MSIQDILEQRRISEILHFSTNRGLLGALATKYILSRPLLSEENYLRHVLQLNSSERPEECDSFDKEQDWLRYVNLSISEINRRFLNVSRSWHNDKDVWWCILSFDPLIVTHEGVYFATTNNSYDQCRRAQGEQGLDNLFSENIGRKRIGASGKPWSVRRAGRHSSLPTCEQAEVLYYEKLSLDHLRTIYVDDEQHLDTVVGWLVDFDMNDVNVVFQPEKFEGKPN